MSSIITYKRLNYNNGSPMELREKTFDTTKLASDEILVKVNSAALNPVDLILYHTARYHFLNRNEKGLGRDFSGTVAAVGSDIKDYSKGDKVSGIFSPIYSEQGTVTQYLRVKPSNSPIGKIPSNLSLKEAATFPLVFSTALSTLQKFHTPNEESRVMVIGGATSVGQYALQLLKNHFHAKLIVSINSSSSAEFVKSLGADTYIDYSKEDVAKSAVDLVNKNGEKFDLIVDCVGNKDLFPVIDDILKPKTEKAGYVTIVGDQVADYNSSAFSFFSTGMFTKMIPFLRNYNYAIIGPAEDYYPLAKKLFEEGKLKTTIDSTYPLTQFKEAYEKLATHKARGKILISCEEEN